MISDELKETAKELSSKIPTRILDFIYKSDLTPSELETFWDLIGELRGRPDWPKWGSREATMKFGIRNKPITSGKLHGCDNWENKKIVPGDLTKSSDLAKPN